MVGMPEFYFIYPAWGDKIVILRLIITIFLSLTADKSIDKLKNLRRIPNPGEAVNDSQGFVLIWLDKAQDMGRAQ